MRGSHLLSSGHPGRCAIIGDVLAGADFEEEQLSSYGPADRALFESASIALYEEIVDAGGVRTDDPRVADGAETRPAFDLLITLGLVLLEADEERWMPVDPSSISAQVVLPLSRQGSQLLEESSGWARSLADLGQVWRRSTGSVGSTEALTHLRGQAIGPYIAALVGECEEELLTAQPQTDRDLKSLMQAAERESEALDRGVRMRTLYQHSARRSTATHQYVAAVTDHGAEVRTLDEFFNRMIVIDRRIAVIPGTDDNRLAIVVRDPGVVAYLADVFERSWQRARPFASRDKSMLKDIAVEQRAMTIRMLIEGHADPASAKRLGVSPRTYAGYVADLKEEFEAQTRFELGYTMGVRGITGNDRD